MSDAAASPTPTTTDLPICDIILKGGITSGIVYPPAIIELAGKYRFCSIGGTSAGGIVSALTAAAEYARQKGTADAFTGRMAKIADELQTRGMVKNLFKPVSALRAPFDIFLSAMKGSNYPSKGFYVVVSIIRSTPLGFLIGGLVGLAIWRGIADGFLYVGRYPEQTLHLRFPGWLQLSLYIFGFVLFALIHGIIGGAISLVWQIFGRLPNNRFGVCTGFSVDEDRMATDSQSAASAPSNTGGKRKSATTTLTNWLHENINYLADRRYGDPPLTISDLERAGISLRMMTSNLSQAQPFVIPFQQNNFLFKKSEMDTLFPHVVVENMVMSSTHSDRIVPPEGYYYLPDDLPVIVAARLSLSFPMLISVVRVYTVKNSALSSCYAGSPQRLTDADLQPNIFSDGGICSNFPIQFFNTLFPAHPIFGINLTNWSDDAFRLGNPNAFSNDHLVATAEDLQATDSPRDEPLNETEAVYLPKANTIIRPGVQPIGGIGGFIMAIFNIAQNFRDNALLSQLTYKERIVEVRLKDSEGGLNLDMPPEIIQQMMEKGKLAGRKLSQEFQFSHHRWVRLVHMIRNLSTEVRDLKETFTPEMYKALVDEMQREKDANQPFPYSRDKAWVSAANENVSKLIAFLKEWDSRL